MIAQPPELEEALPQPVAHEPARPGAPEKASGNLKRYVPLLLAVALVGYVLWRLDLHALVGAFQRTHYAAYLAFTFVFLMALLTADAFATAYVYSKTVCPAKFSELFVIRGASYMASVVNHHVGQGWLTYFFSKTYRAPLWRVAGATLLVYVTTFGCLFVMGAVALPFNVGRVSWLPITVGVLAVGAVVYAAVIYKAPAFLAERQTTAPLVAVGLKGHVVALVYRMPHVFVQFLGTWLPFWFFDVRVPFLDALALIPVIMLVQALPITPQGVGTRDVLALELLAQYAPGTPEEGKAAIAAATLSWAGALTLVQVITSLSLMRRAQAMLQRQQP
ncbi:MAG TPA: lysylphosphatidylglycerol synthase domain-containing protein [Polyangiaceae bacterium]